MIDTVGAQSLDPPARQASQRPASPSQAGASAALHPAPTTPAARDEIGALFAEHYSLCLRVARRILESKEDAEDAVQTAYVAAFRNLHAFRGDAPFAAWITQIVRNCCRAELRRRRSRPSVSLEDLGGPSLLESQEVSPETLHYSNELQTAHSAAASRLTKGLREVYLPCAFSEVPLLAVARRLGLTAPAAKSRLMRARVQVRRKLVARAGRRAAR